MRRGIGIAMAIFIVWSVVTGIWQLFPPYDEGVEPLHIVPAFPLAVLICIHVWLNRKPLVRYFQGLGWKWLWVVLGVLCILWAAIGAPLVAL